MKNFINSPRKYKVYFICDESGNRHWKHIKQRIKYILDSPQVSRYEKILHITGLLEDYRMRYLNDKK